ncbi:MAG: stage III sporulation protein AF [Eubacterium sp.]|nr:stage III sporulation protein AF [Eubacterium sp.]
MDFLKEWTFCVCCSLVAAMILSLLAPGGRMKRFYKVLLSLFIFLSFLYPLRDFKGISLNAAHFFSQEEAEASQENSFQQLADRQIATLLTENGVVGASVTCRAEVDYDTGEVWLQEVQVAVPDGVDTDFVQRLLQEQLGIEARVIHLGE